ncbi:MAG: glutaredoxin family protein [Candidatus Zixiibacteriota bacterium]|nr:MAG: glutaredoxin family protein [candidate division Zixibacteria bacterium]
MPKVTIYTKPGCPYCTAAKEHYTKGGIEFKEIDVYAVEGAKQEAIKLAKGKAMVPVIVEDGRVQVGFGGG